MQKKSTFKSSKGVISIYVGISIITFIIILTAIYTVAVSVRKNQIKTLIKIKEVYEQDNTKIASIYEEQKRLLLEKLDIGSTINYNPEGAYNWQAKYCSSNKTETTDDILLESGTGKSFNITTWKIFSIDRETGKIELIPSAPTSGYVYLGEAQGYNNAVKLLNDACSDLYGNEEKGIRARSINIEDIEKCMTDTALKEAHNYNNGYVTYGEQLNSAFLTHKNYPVIYKEEIKSVINEIEKTSGLNLSEQKRFIERTEGTSTTSNIGVITTATSIQPYQTYWEKKNVCDDTTFFKDKYLELLFPNGASTPTYWIASRYVHDLTDQSGYACFGIRIASTGDIRGTTIRNSGSFVTNYSLRLFPVVTLNISNITYDATKGYIVKQENNETEEEPEVPTGPNGKPLLSAVTEIQYEKNIEAEDKYGNIVMVPAGFKVVEGSAGEEISVPNGVVIEDVAGNQFVWIPVGTVYKNTEKTQTSVIELGRYTFDETNGTPTIQQAAFAGDNPSKPTQTYADLDVITTNYDYQELTESREGSTTGKLHQNATAKNLAKFVESVGINGGYYLARYEASYGSGYNNSGSDDIAKYLNAKPLSKPSTANSTSSMNYNPETLWNFITQINASKVARNMYAENKDIEGNTVGVESDLVNSYAWDTAIVFIQEMGIYNYANKTDENGTLKNTGPTGVGDIACNIYDMASNCHEWTTEENISDTGSPWSCPFVWRGGSYDDSHGYTAYYRGAIHIFAVEDYYSFRPLLYIK